jgi:hypothetical protein
MMNVDERKKKPLPVTKKPKKTYSTNNLHRTKSPDKVKDPPE